MSSKIVIIGGVAAGPKVASKVMRLDPTAEVTVLEKGKFLSYAGCGLPYYVSGKVKEQKDLMSTPVGVVRDAAFFQKVKNVKVLNETEALEIDRARKRVRARTHGKGEDFWLDYDKLVLATGAKPVVPPIPGIKLGNIFTLHGVHDAEGIKALLAQSKARDVVMIGGGLIGVETTEALVESGCRVTLVEMLPQVLRILDWELARLVEKHMESHGVKVLTNAQVTAFEGDGTVREVITTRGRLPADMVVLAIGVRPNVDLARAAELAIGLTGAIQVDDTQRTSDPDIYAVGDCVQTTDLITGKPCFVPLGSTNKQGRGAGANIGGAAMIFPGIVGAQSFRVFGLEVAAAGLNEREAVSAGYHPVSALVWGNAIAGSMPGSKKVGVRLTADRATGKLLGAQALGEAGAVSRINTLACALWAGLGIDEIGYLDLAYAPPFSPSWDPIHVAAQTLRRSM